MGGRDGEPWLEADQGAVRVSLLEVLVINRRTVVREHGIVRARQYKSLGDDAIDGSMPAVVICETEEPLMNCSTNKLLSDVCISAEYVVEQVVLSFEPELVVELDGGSIAEGGGLTGVVNGERVVG